jgi:pimeloyl-ACP methyl ester carboxylesterase
MIRTILSAVLLTAISITGCDTPTDPDTTEPQVSIISPVDGSTVGDTVTVTASVADNQGISSVDFYLDGEILGTVQEEPYETSWDTREAGNGTHTLSCRATDTASNQSISEIISVTVANEPTVTEEEITFTNQLGVELAGTLFHVEGSQVGAVLAHSGVPGQSQLGLHPLARDLTDLGITVLTFDFPGYGRTGGAPAYALVDRDVRTAISYLENLGFSQFAALGVGLGGLGCAKQGLVPGVVGMVLISCPVDVGPGLGINPDDLSVAYPKLFISAELDFANGRPFAQYAQTFYDDAVKPKELKLFSGSYHSMELFESEHADELNSLLLDFFLAL